MGDFTHLESETFSGLSDCRCVCLYKVSQRVFGSGTQLGLHPDEFDSRRNHSWEVVEEDSAG